MQSMATLWPRQPSLRDLRLRPRSLWKSWLDRISPQKKKLAKALRVPAGLQKTRKPMGRTHWIHLSKE